MVRASGASGRTGRRRPLGLGCSGDHLAVRGPVSFGPFGLRWIVRAHGFGGVCWARLPSCRFLAHRARLLFYHLAGQARHLLHSISMATLTMQPLGATSAAQEDPKRVHKPAEDDADGSDIDSGWVVLGKSDIIPADSAAAAAAGGWHLGFLPMPMMPTWAHWVLGGLVYTVVPFYKRVRKAEDETTENVETATEVVEHAAEVTEKMAGNVADALPENGSLHKAAEEVESIAEEVDKDVEKVEAVVKKIDEVSDKIDAVVEPVIEELEKEFKQNQTLDGGSSTQK